MSFPNNQLMKNPAGTYSFVGRVCVKLGWVNKDGSMLSDSEAQAVSTASNPGMLARSRVFKTPAEAIAAAKALNVSYNVKD